MWCNHQEKSDNIFLSPWIQVIKHILSYYFQNHFKYIFSKVKKMFCPQIVFFFINKLYVFEESHKMTFYNMNHPCLVLKISNFLIFRRFIDFDTQSWMSAHALSACWLHHMTHLADKGFANNNEQWIWFSVT